MENAFYINDNDYDPDDNPGMKMSMIEEQVNQESYKKDEDFEEDEKEVNNHNENEKINNFSFGKHDKKLLENPNNNINKLTYIPYSKNFNEAYNYNNLQEQEEEEDEMEENNDDNEYGPKNDEEGELEEEEEDFEDSKNGDSIPKRYEDSEKDTYEEFPNIINLFKDNSHKEKRDILNQRRIMEITEAFNLFDKDCDGNIDIKELATVMRTLGYDPNKEELDDIIKTFDVDESGTIDKEEFINLLTTKLKEQKDDKDLLEIFNMFDKDRDGLISEDDINYISEEIGEKFEKDIIKELK